jgi:hypothetical protein
MCRQVVTETKLRLADRIDQAALAIQGLVDDPAGTDASVAQLMLAELNGWLPQARVLAPAACLGLAKIQVRLCSASHTRPTSKNVLALDWLPEVDMITSALRGVETEREIQEKIAIKYEGQLKLSKLLGKLTGAQPGTVQSPLVRMLAASAVSIRPPAHSMAAPPPPQPWHAPPPMPAPAAQAVWPQMGVAPTQQSVWQQSDVRSTGPPAPRGSKPPRGSRQGSKAAAINPRTACMTYLRKTYEGVPESARPACYACEYIGMSGKSDQPHHKMTDCLLMPRAIQQFSRAPQ